MHVESCYSKIVKLLNKDSFPLSPNLCLRNFALEDDGSRTLTCCLVTLAVKVVGDTGWEGIHKEKKVQRIRLFFHSPKGERGMEWRDTPPLRSGALSYY